MADAPRSVFLVGMMGAGKTTIGARLARRIGWRFIDVDRELEERLGVRISVIFEIEGEAGFRRREASLLEELTRETGVVLATGGGAVLAEGNRDMLAGRGSVVYLRATAQDLWNRLRRDRTRPLLRTADPRGRIQQLVTSRDPLYCAVADVIVDTARQPIERTVTQIQRWIQDSAGSGTPFNPEGGDTSLPQAKTGTSKMQTLDVALGERSYPIQVGDGLLEHNPVLQQLAHGRAVALVTDEHVAPLHAAPLERLLRPVARDLVRIVVPAGEASKDWPMLNRIFDAMLERRFDRQTLVVALGGGVVGDLAGLAAALYQRGVDFVQVPTTLLAQVDSSVGGKTAINHPAGKNMIGVFHQPRLVVVDLATLRTLPQRELAAGLAEVIKHGAVLDRAYFDQVAADMPKLRAVDTEAMTRAILGSVAIKARIVAADEREAGQRALLNLGHTFGHAIESGAGYGKWLHGEAVAAGMVMAAALSHDLGWLSAEELQALRESLQAAGLPVQGPAWSTAQYLRWMSVDKKARAGVPNFVLLEGLGRGRIATAPPDAVDRAIQSHVRAMPDDQPPLPVREGAPEHGAAH